MQDQNLKSETFSERTERLASALGLPLTKLADHLGISTETFSGSRTGRVPISQKTLRKLEAAEIAAGIGNVAETAPFYGKEIVKDSSSDEAEARRLFEETIVLARRNPQRMGWVIEQLKQHLRPLPHWHLYQGDPANHPAVKSAMDAARGKLSAFQGAAKPDSDKTDKDTGLLASTCNASDLALQDGRTLRDATILSQAATTVTVKHAGGLASVPKSQLPEALRAQYPVAEASSAKGQGSGESDSAKQARIAKARADEAARIARAKARQEERAQWAKDNPQEHEIVYRVESTTPSTTVTLATPEKGVRSFPPQFDQWGVYEEKFTAKDGFRLQLGLPAFGTDSRTGKYASTITVSIRVDGTEVRRESLEPRSGSLDMTWDLGAVEQQAVFRSGDSSQQAGGYRVIRQDPGWVGTRD